VPAIYYLHFAIASSYLTLFSILPPKNFIQNSLITTKKKCTSKLGAFYIWF